jgi:hypothetical protein
MKKFDAFVMVAMRQSGNIARGVVLPAHCRREPWDSRRGKPPKFCLDIAGALLYDSWQGSEAKSGFFGFWKNRRIWT